MKLELVPGDFAVCRLQADAEPPALKGSRFCSVTRTADEISVVCETTFAPPAANVEPGWKCIRVVGPLPFEMVGVLASLAIPLAEAKISVFVVSTFDTDYLLVKAKDLPDTIRVLTAENFAFCQPNPVEPKTSSDR